jgi:hypothetical protein
MAGLTVGQVVDRVVDLGMVNRATVDKELELPLTEYGGGDSEAEIVTALLVELGIGFDVHTDDVEHLTGYTSALTAAAACTGGLFTVTDIELADDDDQEVLRFRRNGDLVEWPVDHVDDEYLDTLAFFENIDGFTDAARSARRWAQPTVDGELIPARYIFADPKALEELGREFSVDFEIFPD